MGAGDADGAGEEPCSASQMVPVISPLPLKLWKPAKR
jgi:hypothetical protein